MTVHIFQIGCKNLGRLGFEKFVDKEKFFPEDIVFEGVCEKDFERKERAEKFTTASGIEIEFYSSVDDLYSAAEDVEGEVLIYDAGPVKRHSKHIQRSLSNGFYHLSEKPPSLSRKEHINERKLAAKHDVHYKVDFIERENPVVKKMLEILDDEEIVRLKVFRQSSAGVQRLLQPVQQAHVNDGCTLDEIIHDVYIMDLASSNKLRIENVGDVVFMPRKVDSENFLRIDGSSSNEITEDNSLARVSAEGSLGDIDVELHGSWIGVTDKTGFYDQKIVEMFDDKLIRSEYREVDGESFLDQEAKFVVIEGSRKLVFDLLNQEIYDLEHGKTLKVDVYPRNQLYRVLERTVVDASGEDVEGVSEAEVDGFMSALFDIQELASGKDVEVFDALDKASNLISGMMVSDKDEIDKDVMEGVAR